MRSSTPLLTEGMVGSRLASANGAGGGGRLSSLPHRPRISTIVRLPMVGIVPQHGIAQFEVFAALGQLQVAFARRLQPWDGRAVVFVSDDEESATARGRVAPPADGQLVDVLGPRRAHHHAREVEHRGGRASVCARRSPRSSPRIVPSAERRLPRRQRTRARRPCPRFADIVPRRSAPRTHAACDEHGRCVGRSAPTTRRWCDAP